jgi:Arc/MetJ family transcription regulator
MAASLTSIRLDKKLADKAARILGAKSRTEAVHMALEEVVKLKEFKDALKEREGKLAFANFDK